jgi:hypothetical protein
MAHFTVAASENTFRKLFAVVRDNVSASTSGSKSFGPFKASWAFGFKLSGGTVDLQSNNSVLISELDIVYTPASLTLSVDIPQICVGGFCLIPKPWPWKGCLVSAPKICIFSANPDITLPINLSGLIQSEISGAFRIKTKYHQSNSRKAGMNYLDAEDKKDPNQWQFYLDPIWLDIDIIDIADTIGNILDMFINNAIDALLGWLPGWAKSLIKAIMGSATKLIRKILDIGDDLDEWFSNLLGVSIGLFDFVVTIVADYFANKFPILKVEDPYPIMPYSGSLIPVKVPLLNVGVNITNTEMVLTADVGATL